ncbi:host attachment protein [Dyella sp. BiH032]|uniref:host attachment protein n=1 Tax=Dyella sp. BiH032 TaxID=3075430 RepID=UPI002892B2EF|nr:host attachment protein [Dyella sp. BiH032]WNL44037.1 host attachment protein [Dyella sp. BiH032]
MTHSTWVLITDAARARLFEISAQDGMAEVACFSSPARRTVTPDHDFNDRLPRTQDSRSSHRHAIQPHTTVREKAEQQFARTVADELESGAERKQYDHLILVAPPRFLGVLREQLPETLSRRVVGEIQHDLVSASTQELNERLREAFPREFRHGPS